jgi:hypothetical protein
MIQATAGRLDVGLPPLKLGSLVVVQERVQAGQARPGGRKDRQQEESLGLDQSRGHEKSINLQKRKR